MSHKYRISNYRIFSPTSILIGFLVLAPSVNSASTLEEVVVTAQKREQSIQDVGITITAFTGDQIEALGFENSIDIARMTPGVHISGNAGGQSSQFTIRGVTQADFVDLIEAPNAVYVDDTYIATQQGQVFGLWDLDRIEVLKGPQGTLFGRNATGGLVHYVSRKPTEEFEGYVDLTYGSYDQVRIESAVGGPITDAVSGRVSMMYNYHDEIYDNQFVGVSADRPGEDVWNDDTVGVRGHLLFKPNDDVDILVSASWSDTTTSEVPYQNEPSMRIYRNTPNGPRPVDSVFIGPNETREGAFLDGTPFNEINDGDLDATRPVPGGDFSGFIDADGLDGLNVNKDQAYDDSNKFETYSGTVNATWELDKFTITSITDVKEFEKIVFNDIEQSPDNAFLADFRADQGSFTQELRLNGELNNVRWLLGFHYMDIDADVNQAFLGFPDNPSQTIAAFGFAGARATVEGSLDTESTSVFGHFEYDISDTITAIVGARVIFEKKDFSFIQAFHAYNEVGIQPGTPLADSYKESTSDTLWSGKFELDWRPSDDLLLYASINRGIKAGSFNVPGPFGIAGVTNSDLGYTEEKLIAYEIGFKSTVFDGTTRINGAAYYYDYSDYQVFLYPGGLSGIVRNNDADVHGVDLEVATAPIDGLDIILSAAYVNATITDLDIFDTIRDVNPPYAPEFQFSSLIRYEWPLIVIDGSLAAQIDYSYSSSFFWHTHNFSASKVDDYGLANARLTYINPDEKWTLSVFVNNLTDKTYKTIGFEAADFFGGNEVAIGKPRWFGGQLRYNF